MVWCEKFNNIGIDKRSGLSNEYWFCHNIVTSFDKGVDGFRTLQPLALKLRRLVFFSEKMEEKQQGYMSGKHYGEPLDVDGPDALLRRADPDDINDILWDLLECVEFVCY